MNVLPDRNHDLNALLNYRLLQLVASSIYVSNGPEGSTEIRIFGEFLLLFSGAENKERAFIEFGQSVRPDTDGYTQTLLTYSMQFADYMKRVAGEKFSGFEFDRSHLKANIVSGFTINGRPTFIKYDEWDELVIFLENGSTIHIIPEDQDQAYEVRIVLNYRSSDESFEG